MRSLSRPVGGAGLRQMPTTTFTGRVGLEERALQHLIEHRKELEALGMNVAFWIAKLRAAIDAVKAGDARQESLKAELKAATASVEATDHEAYVIASGLIDAMVGAWGKDSENGVVLARMRSKLHRPEPEAEILPVEAPPS